MGKIPFMPKAKPPSHHSDIRALSALVTKRSLTPWITRAAILVVVTWIWLWICRQILVFGELMRYDRLEPLGPQVVSFLTKMNPYLWWVITAILTLILLSVIRAWLKNSIARSRKTLLSVGDLQQLVGVMSPEGVEVLQWVWDDEQGPITLGDLSQACDGPRSAGCASKCAASRRLSGGRPHNRVRQHIFATRGWLCGTVAKTMAKTASTTNASTVASNQPLVRF